MRVIVLDTPASLAAAVASLPAAGPLPARTVLVPSERHAHALRRSLARGGHGAALAGTRFVGPLTAAIEVLRSAGVPFSPGEDGLRPARLLALFREDLPLEHFERDLLRDTRGWNVAFASAIADLEAAGLTPGDLPRETAHARDLALVWSRVAAEAGTSFGRARIYLEAAALLGRDPGAWPFCGATLAVATGHEELAEARFTRAIPELTLALRVARPARERLLGRMARLYGAEARGLLAAALSRRAPATAASTGELGLLQTYLFEAPDVLADPARPRSAGPDATVALEEHAGVEAELEATATWVQRQVLEAKRPLEELAVLVPSHDPLAGLVADRLERLPFEGGRLPVHVAGGLPAVASAAGARVLAVVRALAFHLSADTLAPVLPALRLEGDAERDHLTHGEAMELAYGLGTVGGNAAHPEGALAWSARAAARVPELEAALAHARTGGDSAAREVRQLERLLRNLRAVRPALDALVEVAGALVGGAPLAALWERISGFLDRLRLPPPEGAALRARLAESLAPVCAGSPGKALSGPDALEVLRDHLLSLRLPRGRFGEPAVYVGTVERAAGLAFEAVRVVGLCEGVLPSQPREDPVLPERLRGELEQAAPACVLPRAEDRVTAQVHGLFAAVENARDAVALSAPRVDLARTEREPASLLVDAAAALARPDAASGAPAAAVPGLGAVARDHFRPAGASDAAFRAARPVSEASWLDRVARVAADLPARWARDPVLALGRLDALVALSGKLGPADGLLGPGDPFPVVPGTSPERPISASALQDLLTCPRMFLMKRVLGWDEPAQAPSLRELDPLSFGNLVHHALESFYREHGAGFAGGERPLAAWQALAREHADRAFDALLREYPLVGEGVRGKERERLRESVRSFLDYDFGKPGRRFVGVELPFGDPAPLAVDADGVTLHVRGYIDRVDVDGGATFVRDVKSGRSYPRTGREANPTAVRDVQLGLYQLVAAKLAPEWGTPRKVVAAYAYANGRAEVVERSFRDDPDALAKATREWLAGAAQLLSARRFPPAVDEDDCVYCPFRPLCGDDATRRAREGLAEEKDGPLARFRAIRLGEGDAE